MYTLCAQPAYAKDIEMPLLRIVSSTLCAPCLMTEPTAMPRTTDRM